MSDPNIPAPTFKKRSNKSSTLRKRPATPPPANSDFPPSSPSSSSSPENDPSSRIKRRKTEGLTSASAPTTQPRAPDLSKTTKYHADRSAAIAPSSDATRSSTWYTDAALGQSDKAASGAGAGAGYGDFITKSAHAADKKAVGPVRAPTNVRAITVTDFAPDVCKDYKQTGFCGFGDSCKFLHAREDYKQGWQLDREWEKAGKEKKKGNGNNNNKEEEEDAGLDQEEKMLKEIPFKCVLCKGDYKMPVVTKCGHYFCEKCAMTRYMKEKKKGCAQCGADTRGSFGVAKKLKDLLERKKKREEEKRENEEEAGE